MNPKESIIDDLDKGTRDDDWKCRRCGPRDTFQEFTETIHVSKEGD